jgi:16S rRNA (guanine1207-N2)-methyltransferase
MKQPEYELKLKSMTENGSKIYKFASADGIPNKNSFREEELALADHVETSEDDEILVVQSGYGFLGAIFADKSSEGHTVIADTSDRAYQLSKMNLRKNSIENASCRKVAYYSKINKFFDKIIYAPHSYEPVKVVKNRISHLIEILELQGQLYIAGERRQGINRYKSYLNSLQGENRKITQDGKQRVYQYTKTEDYTPENLDIETSFEAEVNGVKLRFNACEGLFSPHSLDRGSRLLLENLELDEDKYVLDLACGYGIIGTFIKELYGADIALTDDNSLATHYAENNLETTGIDKYKLVNKDCLDGVKDDKFDAIVSNPPTHQGKGITDEMFEESYNALRAGGHLYIVYNKNMKFEEQISELFSHTEIMDEKDNFYVLKAIK